MRTRATSLFFWHGLGLLVLLLLVACSAAPQEAPAETATRPDATATLVARASETTSPEETATMANVEETRVFTDDNRSARLQAVTRGWNTNWNRRTIAYDELLSGGPPRDGIPSIDNPQFVQAETAANWLADNEPVIAVEINGEARAYPLQILTWHEIANDTVGGVPIVVTFCPLCNSAVSFDRRFGDDVFEFGTSGLLRNSDLVMYDRTTETLWQQFTGEGIVGDLAGEQLVLIPSSLVSFADFREAYPNGIILSRETGFNRSYGQNPYVGYDAIGQNPFLYRGPVDGRLPAMARVVTIALKGEDAAYPYEVLSEKGVVHDEIAGQPLVVFHLAGTSSALGARQIAEGADVGATGVFEPIVDGQRLTFTQEGERFVDEQTGSSWNILGAAVAGPLAGAQLRPIVHGDHFWFSWAAFKPETRIYQPPDP